MAKNKYIETPEKLWDIFVQYVSHIKNNPTLVEDYVGKDGIRVYRQKQRPLTMDGFECFCLENESDVHNYFDNADNRYDEYKTICSRIKKSIKADQIEGGMAGIYNPSITQRLNNLVEKTESKNENNNVNRNINIEVVKSDTPLASNESDINV